MAEGQRAFRVNADLRERGGGAAAQLCIVVHHQYLPVGQDHIGLLVGHRLQVQRDVEFCALVYLALELDGPSHLIHDVFGDGHAQSGTLDFLDPGGILPGKRVKYPLLEFRRHTNAGILHPEVVAHKVGIRGGGLLHQRYGDAPAGGGELQGVG